MISDDTIKVLCIAPSLKRTESLAQMLTGAVNSGDCCIGNDIFALTKDIDHYDCEVVEVNNYDELVDLSSFFLKSSAVFVISDKDYSDRIGIDLKWLNRKTNIDSLRNIIKNSIKSLKKLLSETFDKLSVNGFINYGSLDIYAKLVGESLTEDEIILCLDSLDQGKENILYSDFERWWRKHRDNCSLLKRLVYLGMMNSKLVSDIGLRHELSEFKNKEINMTKSYIKLYSDELNVYSSRIQIQILKSKDKIKLLRAKRPDSASTNNNYIEIDFDFDTHYDINWGIVWLQNTQKHLINTLKGVFGSIADIYQHFFQIEVKQTGQHKASFIITDKLETNSVMEEYLVNFSELSNIIPDEKDIKIDIKSGKLISSMLGLKLFEAFRQFSIELKLNLFRASTKLFLKRFDFYRKIKGFIDLAINHQNCELKLKTTPEKLLDSEFNFDFASLSHYLDEIDHHEAIEQIKSMKIHMGILDLYGIIEFEGFK
jgi:hypothetical protein